MRAGSLRSGYLKVMAGTGSILVCALACLAAAARAQSPAASLPGYKSALKVAAVAGVSAKSFSGAAFHPGTGTVYVIDNDNASIYELDVTGRLLRTLATTGFSDPEGIAWQGDDYFLIAEEGLANVVRVRLPRTGTGPVAKSSGTALNLGPAMANSGIEGVAYRAGDKTAFAVKEIDPPRMYRIALDATGNPSSAAADQPFAIGGKSGDAADILALEDGNFILVDQEQGRLEGFGPQGQALGTFALGMAKPEGAALDAATGTLYVVGEPLEFQVLKPGAVGLIRPPRPNRRETSRLPWPAPPGPGARRADGRLLPIP